MTKEEIDKLLDDMAAEAVAKGDDDLRPGLIYLNDRLYGTQIRTETVSAKRGQRYRGVRVFVSRGYDTKVVTRKETAGIEVGEFEDLTESIPNPE
ncbi:MAG: hypothetical protein QM608_08075 [Caulobacter sp.]